MQTQIDEKRFIISAGASFTGKNSKWTFKFPRNVWRFALWFLILEWYLLHFFSVTNDAEQFFDKMEERNNDTYNALMVGLFKVSLPQ